MLQTVTRTSPRCPAVTNDEACRHLELNGAMCDCEDPYLAEAVDRATQEVEDHPLIRRAFCTQSFEWRLRGDFCRCGCAKTCFCGGQTISFPYAPVDELTVTVDGPAEAWAEYLCAHSSGEITVTFDAGYGDTEDVPEALKAVVLRRVYELYLRRAEHAVNPDIPTVLLETYIQHATPYLRPVA